MTADHSPASWRIDRVGDGPARIVIHVPHASVAIPDDVRDDLLLDDGALRREVHVMTDWFTDELALDAAQVAGVPVAIFRNLLSRLVGDPERLPDDIEPMARLGMGRVYRLTSDLQPLRQADPARDAALVARFFDPYAAAMSDLVEALLAEHGRVVIVDLHSYPSRPLPYELDPTAHRPGLCVGADPDHTSAALREAVWTAFAGHPGGIAENTPFAGCYVPLRHHRSNRDVLSVMLELRRDTYLQEPAGPRHAGYDEVVGRVGRLLGALDTRST